MMSFEEYNLLTEEQQHNCWLHNSVAVARQQGDVMIKLLYQMDSFYIELTCLKNFPHESYLTTFADTSLLDYYLPDINIEHLQEQ